MEQKNWFESWFGSPYYKVLYQNRDKLEARAFIENIIEYLEPLPYSNMLDIACGEGRHAIQLAEHKFDVTGIDLSHRSIEKAKESEREGLQFFIHDMRFPFYINYFDYAFNFFTSFGYFNKDRDHHMAAKSFARALKPGGLLVIDYLNREYTVNSLVQEETIERGGISFNIKRRLERDHIIKDISFKDNEGKEHCYNESVAAFSLSDFIKIFKKAGMKLVSNFGDYQLNNYDPSTSPRLIMIFKKQNVG
ncbi:MAG: methyltransferase domain-containing protein [Flavipsychrobacter sp.]